MHRMTPDQELELMQCCHTLSFPYKLYKILECPYFTDTLHWSPDGEYVYIVNNDRFMDSVLTKYFRYSRWTSFTRTLNTFGFRYRRLNSGDAFLSNVRPNNVVPEDVGASGSVLSHAYFWRDRFDLLGRIVRSPRDRSGERRRRLLSLRTGMIVRKEDEVEEAENEVKAERGRSTERKPPLKINDDMSTCLREMNHLAEKMATLENQLQVEWIPLAQSINRSLRDRHELTESILMCVMSRDDK